jgi:hypothetical protein
MKRLFSARAASMFTWVLILVAVPSGLYVNHVYNQLSEVRENNLRTLGKAAEITEQRLSNALQNVANLENKPKFICAFLSRQPFLSWGGAGACDPSGGEHSQNPEVIRTVARAVEAKDEFKLAYLQARGDGLKVIVPKLEGLDVTSEIDPNRIRFTFDVALDALLAAIPFSDTVDLLLVADGGGNVIHQYRPPERDDSGLLVRSIDGLVAIGDTEPLEVESIVGASSVNSVRISEVDYELLCQPLDLASTSVIASMDEDESAASRDWLLCGLIESERSLRQSLAVAPFLAFTFFTVIVFGFLTWPVMKLLWMTQTDRLHFVDLGFLLFGTFGSLMLAVILILGIGSHNKLSGAVEADLRNLATRIEGSVQGEVDKLIMALSSMDRSVSEIVRCESGQVKNAFTHCTNDDKRLDDLINLYKNDDQSEILLTLPPGSAEGDTASGDTWPVSADFEMAFWTDCTGQQLLKVTVYDTNTPRVNVSHRQYFRAAVQDRLWQPLTSGKAADQLPPRYVEPVRSVTTGKFGTIMSIRSTVDVGSLRHATRAEATDDSGKKSGGDTRKPEACNGVAALQAVLTSTSNTVLPPGMGFAIVDESGNAVLHSDERRALFDNFFEELEDGDRLEAMILARTENYLRTGYLGKPHNVFIQPMSDLPWSVVVFSDSEMVSTVNLEILGHAALAAFVYLLVCVVVAVAYFAKRGAEVPLWFWPGAHCGPVGHLAVTIPVIALVALLGLIRVLWDRDGLLLVCIFLTPLTLFLALWSVYRWHPALRNKARYSQDVTRAQIRSKIAASLVVWIVIAVIPGAVFFQKALDRQASLLVRYENEYLTEELVARNCAIDDFYRSIKTADASDGASSVSAAAARKLGAIDGIYPSTVFAGARFCGSSTARDSDDAGRIRILDEPGLEITANGEPATTIWSAFTSVKPIYNSTVLRSRYLVPDADSDRANNASWTWLPACTGDTSCNGARDCAKFVAGPLPCSTGFVEISSTRQFLNQYFLHPLVIAMVAALLMLIFWGSRYEARKLFFGDLRMPRSQFRDREELERRLLRHDNDSKTRVVAVVASQDDRSQLLQAPGDHDTSSQGHFNRYDMLDFSAGSQKREALRDSLTRDIEAGVNILLIAPSDPYVLVNSDEAPEPENLDDTTVIQSFRQQQRSIQRWRRILSLFRVINVTVNQDPPPRQLKGAWQREPDRIADEEWLESELDALPELAPLRQLLPREVIGSTRKNAIDRLVERAFGAYMGLWDACTRNEKLVLVQLASEAVVNPKQEATVRSLLQRGLLVRDPGLRIFNESFARFLMQIQDPDEVKRWERTADGISWAHSRWIVLGFLLLALLFLWATQRELFNSTITFLTAAVVGLPGLVKVLSNLTKLSPKGDSAA